MFKAKNKYFYLIILMCLCMMINLFGCLNDVQAEENNLTPNSKASYLMEFETGKILYEKDSLKQLPIASVTKLTTLLIIFEKVDKGEIDIEKEITISPKASSMGGSQVFLEANKSYKIKNLIKSIIIASANDSSVALAEEVAGSESAFCDLMNKKANELKLENTHYENSTGLPAPMQYSCAKDVAIIMREVIKHPLYFEFSKIWMEDFVHNNERVTTMANTNKLLKSYQFCDGGKTGSTNEAGYCLASTAKKDNLRLISVVLGSDTGKNRFMESKNLFEYGFNNFNLTKLVDKTLNLSTYTKLEKAEKNEFLLSAEKDYYEVLKKGEQSNLILKIDLPKTLKAPLKSGDIVGKIQVTENDVVIDEINILVNSDVDEISYKNILKTIAEKWLI